MKHSELLFVEKDIHLNTSEIKILPHKISHLVKVSQLATSSTITSDITAIHKRCLCFCWELPWYKLVSTDVSVHLCDSTLKECTSVFWFHLTHAFCIGNYVLSLQHQQDLKMPELCFGFYSLGLKTKKENEVDL